MSERLHGTSPSPALLATALCSRLFLSFEAIVRLVAELKTVNTQNITY